MNILDADRTLVILLSQTPKLDDGIKLTIKFAEILKKLLKIIFLESNVYSSAEEVIFWIYENKIKCINVAGPRESDCLRIYL